MTPAELICAELSELGLAPRVVVAEGFFQNTAVVLEQNVPTGRFKNQTLTVAIGFQDTFILITLLTLSMWPNYRIQGYPCTRLSNTTIAVGSRLVYRPVISGTRSRPQKRT